MAPKFNIDTADEASLKDRIKQLTSAVLPTNLHAHFCDLRGAAVLPVTGVGVGGGQEKEEAGILGDK